MKIKFIGTSHGVPLPDRHYQGVLIETEKGDYLFDAGAPVMESWINAGYDMTRLKTVFVTHVHHDHMYGLLDMVILGTWSYREMNFDIYMPEQRGVDAVKEYSKSLLQGRIAENIRYHVYEEGVVFDDGNIKVTSVHSDHMSATTDIAYGFLIEADGKRVYLTGDLHGTLKDFPIEVLSVPTDVLITECAHFSAEKLADKVEQANVEKFMVIHVFPLDKFEKLKDCMKNSEIELIFPDDGSEYQI